MFKKKIVSLLMVLFTVVALTGCRNNDDGDQTSNEPNDSNTQTSANRPFTESEGTIRYLTIEDIQVAIPETVGEYARYLEQVGTRVELISNPNRPDDITSLSDTIEANSQSSLNAYFIVYMTNGEYQRFGIHYINDEDNDIAISEAEIGRIIFYYDTYAEQPADDLLVIDSVTFVTDLGEFALDGTTTSRNIMNLIGAPDQNTDGYLTYNDESGFVYRFATSNLPGILTQVDITYPR